MASVNKCIFIGNLGRDPEMRYMDDGTACANFSVAVTEKWKSKDGGQQEKTEWVRVCAWRRLAEICGEYLSKGSQVYVEGKMQTRQWEKDGVTRYTTEIVAHTVQFLGGRGGQQQASQASPQQQSAPVEPPDDDIPF